MVVVEGAEERKALLEGNGNASAFRDCQSFPETPPILGRYDFMTFFSALLFALLLCLTFGNNRVLIHTNNRLFNASLKLQNGA